MTEPQAPTRPFITADCRQCGQQFTYERIGKRLRMYCSPQCSGRAGRIRAAAGIVRKPQEILNCEHCGNSFAAKLRTQRFCSDACRHRSYNAHRPIPIPVGPESASDSLRQRVFNRDGWRCLSCDCDVQVDRHEATDSAVMRMLDVGTRPRSRCIELAVTLCRSCCGRLQRTTQIIAAVAARRRVSRGNAVVRLDSQASGLSQQEVREGP